MSNVINLDQGIDEYVEFIVNGVHYKMRYLTSEEVRGLMKFKPEEEDKAIEFLQGFIENVNEGEPSFKEIYPKMAIPKVKRFINMVADTLNVEPDIDGADKS